MTKKKILVVEDDWVLRDLIGDIVRELGVQEISATSGSEGLQKFKENQPHLVLVITDLQMETPDAGLVLTRQIKKLSSTPVIMVTGRAKEIERIKEKERIDAIIPKPFRIGVLREAIKKFLERR